MKIVLFWNIMGNVTNGEIFGHFHAGYQGPTTRWKYFVQVVIGN